MTEPIDQHAATTYGGQPERATTWFARGGVLPPSPTFLADLHLDECILEVHPTYSRCVRAGHVGLNQPHREG